MSFLGSYSGTNNHKMRMGLRIDTNPTCKPNAYIRERYLIRQIRERASPEAVKKLEKQTNGFLTKAKVSHVIENKIIRLQADRTEKAIKILEEVGLQECIQFILKLK